MLGLDLSPLSSLSKQLGPPGGGGGRGGLNVVKEIGHSNQGKASDLVPKEGVIVFWVLKILPLWLGLMCVV